MSYVKRNGWAPLAQVGLRAVGLTGDIFGLASGLGGLGLEGSLGSLGDQVSEGRVYTNKYNVAAPLTQNQYSEGKLANRMRYRGTEQSDFKNPVTEGFNMVFDTIGSLANSGAASSLSKNFAGTSGGKSEKYQPDIAHVSPEDEIKNKNYAPLHQYSPKQSGDILRSEIGGMPNTIEEDMGLMSGILDKTTSGDILGMENPNNGNFFTKKKSNNFNVSAFTDQENYNSSGVGYVKSVMDEINKIFNNPGSTEKKNPFFY